MFQFMGNHPILTFFLAAMAGETIHCCFKEVASIFKRPELKKDCSCPSK